MASLKKAASGRKTILGGNTGEMSIITSKENEKGLRFGQIELGKDQVGKSWNGVRVKGKNSVPIYARNSETGNEVANREKSSNRKHGKQVYNIKRAFGIAVG